MDNVTGTAISEAFKYDFLIGILTVLLFLCIVGMVMMWKYMTSSFTKVVGEFNESLSEFTGMLHEIKGSLNAKN